MQTETKAKQKKMQRKTQNINTDLMINSMFWLSHRWAIENDQKKNYFKNQLKSFDIS